MLVTAHGLRVSSRVRNVLLCLMLASLHHASLEAQSVPTSYNLEDLDGLGYGAINGYGSPRMNRRGQVVGLIPPEYPDPVLGSGLVVYTSGVGWENIGPAPTFPGGCANPYMYATDMTDSGQVVGYVECNTSGYASVGFVYDGVSYEYISPPDGRETLYLTGINESGTTTGYSYDSDAGPPYTRAVVIPSGGTAQIIAFPNGDDAYPITINDAGYIVGRSGAGPWVYYNGTTTVIPVPDGEARDVNKYGHVVGYTYELNTGVMVPFIYRDGTVVLPPLPSTENWIHFTGINDAGVIIGRSDLRGLVYTDETGFVTLESLVDPLLGATFSDAKVINNAGQILATGQGSDWYDLVILTPSSTCDPESSSLTFRGNSGALTTQPRLTIVDPCGPTTFRIDATPAMSTVFARAVVTGVTPDPTTSLSYDWEVVFTHTTRQTHRRTLTKTFEMSFGSMMPPLMFFDPPTAPAETISGGDMLLKVATTLPGGLQLFAERFDIRVLGTNPPKADIQAALIGTESIKTLWLKKIACKESQQRQFSTVDVLGQFQMEGEPKMNMSGDGGIGIMQYTENDPVELPDADRWDLLWNWRKNVTAGINLFQGQKWAFALGFPAQMRTRTQAAGTLGKTNQYRASQSLPPLDEVHIRDFVRSGPTDEVLEDAVRAYNGYGGTDQFGGPLHEFRLKTLSTAFGLVFAIEHERVEGVLRVADAVWERVPVSARPAGFGVPNYVELVRGMDPACP